jgi:hypothetical protein
MHTAITGAVFGAAIGKMDTGFRAPMHSRNKNRRRLTACGSPVGAPHELFARPPLSPLFHLYTLAPLCLRIHSGHSGKVPLLDFSRTRKPARHLDQGQADVWTLNRYVIRAGMDFKESRNVIAGMVRRQNT